MSDKTYTYRSPAKLGAVVRFMVLAGAVVSIFIIIANYEYLTQIQRLMVDPESLDEATIIAVENRTVYVESAGWLLFLITAFFFLKWIYRINANAHTLEDENLTISPPWSVGYYFVPILNLWRPYRAMTEAYSAIVDASGQQERKALFGWWWCLWLIANGGVEAANRLYLQAETLEEMEIALQAFLVAQGLQVVMHVIAATMVIHVTRVCVRTFEADENREPTLRQG